MCDQMDKTIARLANAQSELIHRDGVVFETGLRPVSEYLWWSILSEPWQNTCISVYRICQMLPNLYLFFSTQSPLPRIV